ncbi:1-acyl-sn-glycerol-3-phosphate acyltransferase [Salisaeta longa]|uniref:1-acyl-sn-glycerol-3-phosphate acyltransferase n=1 Tax=Salisaeta longa TaxID=503170 RepID=UPI00048B7C3A|nr:1-acyl-sn-glycerol-3-phosphate acyltransferase [Salisaeta longa]
MMPFLIRTLIRYELWQAFRWIDYAAPQLPALPEGPVICYANHHHVYDAHLLWYLVSHTMGRPSTVWMEEWDRYPLFAPVGAQPFPASDPARRAATVRRTARRFRSAPRTVLVYFPEGELHAPEEGLRPFPSGAVERLARLYPNAHWWPVGLHVTWRGHQRPVALLRGGTVQPEPPRTPRATLQAVWRPLRDAVPGTTVRLMRGPRARAERWSLRWTRGFFARYLR